MIPRHIFREYDIRGLAARDLSDELVRQIGLRFGQTIAANSAGKCTIAVSYDGRLTSPRLFAALSGGIVAAGCDVIDIGLGPTPQLYFAAHHLATDGAIMITGSHNPAPDNGFKLMRGKASFFGAEIQTLADSIERADDPAGSGGERDGSRGRVDKQDVSEAYIQNFLASTRIAAISERPARKLRVVVDAGNGAAGPLALRVFERLGLAVDPLFCDIDGNFPNHHPDPTVEDNLLALRDRVLATKADVGLAFDGDGDRLGAIDERGDIVWGDKLMILFSRAVLAENPGATILGEVKCSETLFRDIEARGGRALYAKTGHSLIKTRMKAEGALLAGEMSGHLFFADRYQGFDDATYAAARLIEIMMSARASLSELLSDVPLTYATPEIRVECPDAVKFAVVDGVLAHYKSTHRVLDIDGARIDFGNGAWGLCRASNTQPVLVLRFEAGSKNEVDALRSRVEEQISKIRAELGV